jgi:hypothetical protein
MERAGIALLECPGSILALGPCNLLLPCVDMDHRPQISSST